MAWTSFMDVLACDCNPWPSLLPLHLLPINNSIGTIIDLTWSLSCAFLIDCFHLCLVVTCYRLILSPLSTHLHPINNNIDTIYIIIVLWYFAIDWFQIMYIQWVLIIVNGGTHTVQQHQSYIVFQDIGGLQAESQPDNQSNIWIPTIKLRGVILTYCLV